MKRNNLQNVSAGDNLIFYICLAVVIVVAAIGVAGDVVAR